MNENVMSFILLTFIAYDVAGHVLVAGVWSGSSLPAVCTHMLAIKDSQLHPFLEPHG